MESGEGIERTAHSDERGADRLVESGEGIERSLTRRNSFATESAVESGEGIESPKRLGDQPEADSGGIR